MATDAINKSLIAVSKTVLDSHGRHQSGFLLIAVPSFLKASLLRDSEVLRSSCLFTIVPHLEMLQFSFLFIREE
jgi:hypothetical protein